MSDDKPHVRWSVTDRSHYSAQIKKFTITQTGTEQIREKKINRYLLLKYTKDITDASETNRKFYSNLTYPNY